ncbi:PHP domain-containing protein [Photobacterium sp. BZF1]|uniref:PHP domain-containing protein n=1 Tax=Photobacterium sp. BZF1 TaxID=1904457 RepID=UPI001653BB7F|nr:PHP domain-containing protein [Photobacterium sp. BZF1]MBC7004729.1 PHP domain-containing protein [Photobacterium sp. BZF1]
MESKLIKKISKNKKWIFFISFLAFVIYLISRVFSNVPLVQKVSIEPAEVKNASEHYHYVHHQLFSYNPDVDITLTGQDIDEVFKALSFVTPRMNSNVTLTSYGAVLNGTLDVSNRFVTSYLNFSCLFITNDKNSLDSCRIGSLSIPGHYIKSTVSFLLKVFFDDNVNDVFNQLMSNIEISKNKVELKATKKINLKEEVKVGLKDIASIYKSIRDNKSYNFEPSVIEEYVKHIVSSDKLLDKKDASLSEVFEVAFNFSATRSKKGSADEENENALWAVAIAFGNPRFAEVINVNTKKLGLLLENNSVGNIVLSGRGDLALHFLYSAVIERISSVAVSLNIGEMKELFDANEKGSGFDFSDLIAGIAGAKFGNFISSNEKNALISQEMLSNRATESIFFPDVSHYPRSIDYISFKQYIGSTESKKYLKLLDEAESHVSNLPLYSSQLAVVKVGNSEVLEDSTGQFVHSLPWINDGIWLSTDTHIHTKYSDGSHSIDEVSEQAMRFGCDVIAITDHADGDLDAGSLDYFLEIESINDLTPELLIISGIEWNLPPYNGREHATILFPEGEDTSFVASRFREKFDDFNNSKNPFLTVQDGLKWLESRFVNYSEMPVVFYNHPSRKVDHVSEVHANLEKWSYENNVLIGFSGAPGHQRMPAGRMGAYHHKVKTVNRWDPTVSIVGGVWDKLLSNNVLIWGARAPSDFHGELGDFWPCQFSETKVFAKNNSINAVLEAFRKGSFYASHGKIIKSLSFTIDSQKLPRQAHMGEVITIPTETSIGVNLNVVLNSKNWKGKPSKLDEVEMIITSQGKTNSKIFNAFEYIDNNVLNVTLSNVVIKDDTIIRWRGRTLQKINGDYMFYTNPIIIKVSN